MFRSLSGLVTRKHAEKHKYMSPFFDSFPPCDTPTMHVNVRKIVK